MSKADYSRLVLRSKRARALMALPFAISIPRDPPDSIMIVKELFNDFNLSIIATVGDVVSFNVAAYWRKPDLRVIDLSTRRSTIIQHSDIDGVVYRVRNERSTLNYESFSIMRNAYASVLSGNRVTIIVDGEEDLLAIPAVLEAPGNTGILYGLYTGYLVLIPVVNEYKILMLKLLTLLDRNECETLRNCNSVNNYGWKNS
ncbi:GTP-dependent dephospho-CoA kinase family protein [Caldivirga sp. UBA161]|uniref:GTP-dependent dephospho-CoA kinase family protein n=1 Tax=Caldivirga sp. UBA161 TaxID=1915569 RepID=UPI0025BF8338|nr:GTP-dependent dephospho-CoA kinase family protein [Caldivirga sp. UBA161]